jgi:dipeptidyl aminopeptidase/acylaminoacyl peptidase
MFFVIFRCLYAFVFCSLFISKIYSQSVKPLLTDTSYKAWTFLNQGTLSNNGKFIYYVINNKPVDKRTLVVTSNDRSWIMESPSYSNPHFSDDSRYLFVMQGNDSLVQLELTTKRISILKNCSSYELFRNKGTEWLIYKKNDMAKSLVIKNLNLSSSQILLNVKSYVINSKGNALISTHQIDSSNQEILKWTDLSSGKSKNFYQGDESSEPIFDHSGGSMAFTAMENNHKNIWYYTAKYNTARLIATDSSKGIATSFKISTDIWMFSTDGSSLFFAQTLNEQNNKEKNPKIWSYEDAFLRSRYEGEIGKPSIIRGRNLTMMDLNKNEIRQLLSGSQIIKGSIDNYVNTDLLLVESSFGQNDELPWNKYAQPKYFLLSTKTGELKATKINLTNPRQFVELSPDNKYIVYFDESIQQYLSYDIQNDKTQIIGENIMESYDRVGFSFRNQRSGGVAGIVGWVPKRESIIIQGTYDLWELNLNNSNTAKCLTAGNGERNKTIFSIINAENKIFTENENVWISGFDLSDKSYKIYSMDLSKKKLEFKYFSNTALDRPYTDHLAYFQKAKRGKGFLLGLQKASSSLNYFYTEDFKKIIPVSNNHPENKHNWITSELIKYKDASGNDCEGVVYKPENFDDKKKYPVIFYYYTDYSNLVNNYLAPELSGNGINVPVLVSNGYILCIPNIYRTVGKPGQSALLSVDAAATYLSSFGWIDSTKMAVCGHSLGGFETNYIVSHSNRFKAAYAPSGVSSLVEIYNECFGETGCSIQSYVKNGGFVMAEGLEKNIANYIENSPILFAKDINTPLLLMHNEEDNAVPVTHSKQLFVQLRSLQKPTWLLQYKGEKHQIGEPENQTDLQTRVKSFFDYYLKGSEKPQWMINHISPDNLN